MLNEKAADSIQPIGFCATYTHNLASTITVQGNSTMWKYTGKTRPPFAAKPGPGQESVWDYPRPPRLEHCKKSVEVYLGDHCIARTTNCYRLLETASPPTFYLAPDDIIWDELIPIGNHSDCEWKGPANYFAVAGDPNTPIAWCYPNPRPPYTELKDFVAFYPGRIACYVDGERVQPQPGHFYGGWITNDLAGPFKGEPNTGHW